ncbi:predicted protein [Naegleria gruberi]|uniref:Predicted protein n=1 Tax=Naegleria gruberi TaxID=5762 RepID=D2VJB5_NAEGR|nr:uncharacterized protein NAEGRDRAFT_68978 [Naegleria gruberi]EFC42916.1 predicted protein [Naegleria gruberi]|eukprot:XP_002675660.1 predicted protein [Naegleria gruberi strain NEG-M]
MSGVTQEYIFTQYKGFDFGFFATLIQFIVYAGFGYFGYRKTKTSSSSAHSDALLRVNSTLNFEDEIKFISPSTLLPISSSGSSNNNTNNNNYTMSQNTTHQYKSTFNSNYSNNTFNNFNTNISNNHTYNNNYSTQSTQSSSTLKNYLITIFNLLHFDNKLPIKYYFILGSCMVIGMGLGNQSLAYLNYPTKVLFKSSKLLITMFVGVLLLRKRYKTLDYLASIFLLLGLFSLVGANQHHSINSVKFEYFGVFLISLSLIFDSISSNYKRKY